MQVNLIIWGLNEKFDIYLKKIKIVWKHYFCCQNSSVFSTVFSTALCL